MRLVVAGRKYSERRSIEVDYSSPSPIIVLHFCGDRVVGFANGVFSKQKVRKSCGGLAVKLRKPQVTLQ